MALYDSIDLEWTWDGDYKFDEKGDVSDTSANYLNSIVQEVQTHIKSETLDWEKDITVGCNLSDFKGLPNNRETAKAIEDRIRSTLANQGIVKSGDLSIRVVPVHNNQVLILIRINAQPTTKNSLTPGEPLKIDFVYDNVENDIFFLADNTTAKRAR